MDSLRKKVYRQFLTGTLIIIFLFPVLTCMPFIGSYRIDQIIKMPYFYITTIFLFTNYLLYFIAYPRYLLKHQIKQLQVVNENVIIDTVDFKPLVKSKRHVIPLKNIHFKKLNSTEDFGKRVLLTIREGRKKIELVLNEKLIEWDRIIRDLNIPAEFN